MIDLHAHILPGWDDGAGSWAETRKMCGIAREDGIEKIVATPHVFRLNKQGNDWPGLESRFAELARKAPEWGIAVGRGAEVFIHHDMARTMRERNLTLEGTSYVFVEFPQECVLPGARDLFFSLMLDGYIPIISHPERNREFAERPDLLYELVAMGALAQVTAQSLEGGFGESIRKTAIKLLRHNLVHIIASDAHDTVKRPPRLSAAVVEAAFIAGIEKAQAMTTSIPEAVLGDKAVPDWGEPENPVKAGKKWTIRLPGRKNKGGG